MKAGGGGEDDTIFFTLQFNASSIPEKVQLNGFREGGEGV